MNEKQTAELLDGLRTAFLNRANRDGVLSRFWGMVGDRTAGQEDAANYAARLGEVLSETLLEETVAVGDGRIRLAEALTGTDPEELLRTVDGTLGQMMRQAYRMVNDAGAQAQKIADEANGLGLRSVLGNYPDERLQGLYRKIAEAAERQSGERSSESGEKSPDMVESWLGEPVVNNVQAFYDEHVRANAEARFRMGLGPVIVRTAAPGCCAWCAKLSGVYDYDDVRDTGNDVFRRHERCRCTVTFRNGGTVQDVWSKKIWDADKETLGRRLSYGLDDNKQKQSAVDFTERRKQRLAERRNNGSAVDFDSMNRNELLSYAKNNINTQIDFKGAEETAIRGTIKAVKRFEAAGGDIGDTKIVFGGTGGMYGLYDPTTNTLHLRKNDGFVERLQKENERALLKLHRVQWIDPTYEGMVSHELGHAFDRHFGEAISREISADKELIRKAFSISNYAATSPAYGSPRASEAVAENIAAYLAGGAKKDKIDPDVLDVLDRFFGKQLAKAENSDIIKKSNKEVREQYVQMVEAIREIDQSLPLEQRARQVFDLRNQIKKNARDMMADENARKLLDEEKPIPTFEQMVEHKMTKKKMSYEEALTDIIKTATKTNEEVNKQFGVESKE